ncbi:MAG: winged helix-turn-helix domain-containing protein [Conexivisphaerales archaeon]
MLDITIISDITTIIALILSIIAVSYIMNYRLKLKDFELISDVIALQNNKIADIAWKIDLLSRKTPSSENGTKHINEAASSESLTTLTVKEPIKKHQVNELESIIINNLKNQELTSSEIQAIVGKTREHVSRTLKKMVDEGTLERDESHKPYKYKLISKSNLE